MLVTSLVAKLKEEGSIKSVYLFGDTDVIPVPPYVVVKPEAGTNNTRQIRIIAHHRRGYFDDLEHYIFVELNTLLREGITDEDGTKYTLYKAGYTDITPEVEDNTFFMERLYTVPLRNA